MNSRLLGAFGEQTAARFLRTNGYEILSGNFKSNTGEIDIIAKDDNILCFIEVKTRKVGGLTRPADAVDYRKQENIRSTASTYMNYCKITGKFRFDVIEVLVDEQSKVQSVNHIINAF